MTTIVMTTRRLGHQVRRKSQKDISNGCGLQETRLVLLLPALPLLYRGDRVHWGVRRLAGRHRRRKMMMRRQTLGMLPHQFGNQFGPHPLFCQQRIDCPRHGNPRRLPLPQSQPEELSKGHQQTHSSPLFIQFSLRNYNP